CLSISYVNREGGDTDEISRHFITLIDERTTTNRVRVLWTSQKRTGKYVTAEQFDLLPKSNGILRYEIILPEYMGYFQKLPCVLSAIAVPGKCGSTVTPGINC